MSYGYIEVNSLTEADHLYLRCSCFNQKMREGKYPIFRVTGILDDYIEVKCPGCGTVVCMHVERRSDAKN